MVTAYSGSILERDTLAAQCQRIARLGAFLDVYCLLTINGNDINVGTQSRLRKGDRHFAVCVVALSLQDRVRLNTELDIQCSVRAAACTRLTFAGDREHIARIDARRDVDFQFFFHDGTTTATLLAQW